MKLNKNLTIIIVIGALFYLAFGFLSGHLMNYLNIAHTEIGDPLGYLEAAKNLMGSFYFDSLRTIGISTMNGIPMIFSSNLLFQIQSILFFQMLSWLFTAVFIYLICREFCHQKSSLIASLFFITLTGPLILSYYILSETFFTFFLISSLYFLLKYKIQKKPRPLIFFYSLITIAALTRPILLYFSYFIILIAFIASIKPFGFKKSILLLLLPLSIFGIQLAGMKHSHNEFKMSDGGKDKIMYKMGALAQSIKNDSDINFEIECWKTRRDSTVFSDKIDYKQATLKLFVDEVREDFFYFVKAYFISLKYNTIGASINSKNNFEKRLSTVQNCLLILLLFIMTSYQVFQIVKKNKLPNNLLLLLGLLCWYLYLMGGLFFWQGDRYHVPLFPLIIILFFLMFYFEDHEIRNSHTRS